MIEKYEPDQRTDFGYQRVSADEKTNRVKKYSAQPHQNMIL